MLLSGGDGTVVLGFLAEDSVGDAGGLWKDGDTEGSTKVGEGCPVRENGFGEAKGVAEGDAERRASTQLRLWRVESIIITGCEA
jgi:hypothetical protein